MTASELHEAMRVLSEIITRQEWDRLPEILHDDVVFEYPQSGERFRGVANVKAQFENYPDLDPGGSELTEVIGEDAYALTPSYTLIRVEGSGAQGTAVIRVRYPDDSQWWAVNLFEVRDGRIVRSRSYFAPDFEAPEWRAPFREAP